MADDKYKKFQQALQYTGATNDSTTRFKKGVSTYINPNNYDKPQELIEGYEPAYNVKISSDKKLSNELSRTIDRPLTARIRYPHIAIGTFSKAFRDYVHYEVYPHFNSIIFGSYNKSIQSYLQRMRYRNENGEESPNIDIGLPIFSYTLNIEGTDEKLDFPWRTTTWFPRYAWVMYDPFYQDEEMSLRIVFRRLRGTINANIYSSSQAELLDIQMSFIDAFRGFNVFNQVEIRSMTVLPTDLMFTDFKGRRIAKSLSSNKIAKSFIPDINNTVYYIYNNTSAWINMGSLSENSNYYGGQNQPEFNMSGTFNFELEVPQYVLCLTRQEYAEIELNVDVAYKYEDKKVANAIRYITGKHIGNDLDLDDYESGISLYENGRIVNKVAYTIQKEFINLENGFVTLPCYQLFKNPDWHFKNRDVIIFIVYAGGVIRVPFDSMVSEFTENGDILIKNNNVFNIDDFIELFVFKLTKDIDF